ncbi:MAG: hypothetical protein E7180_04760 [Erysipelotrichaceae bacterium]|nr:hypothetical protein [Erysipelotrichaceae bacterium]
MKTFIKNVLLFLTLMIFVTMLFQSIGYSDSKTDQSVTQENIDMMEGQISNNNQVNDGYYDVPEQPIQNKVNPLSNFINLLAEFFTKAINFIIKLVMGLISAFLS